MFSVELDAKVLLRTLSLFNMLIEKRNVNHVSSFVKLMADDHGLFISGSDGTVILHNRIEAKVNEKGVIAIDGQVLDRVVKNLDDSHVKIEYCSKKSQLMLFANNFELHILTIDPEKFVFIDEIDGQDVCEMENKELSDMIYYTEFSCSREETRYNLNGVYLHNDEGNLVAVATDGHRLSFCKKQLKVQDDISVILPIKTAQIILNCFRSNYYYQHSVKIKVNQHNIEFNTHNLCIISKLVDGKFPNYQNFIPKDDEERASLSIKTETISKVVERVASITDDKFRAIKFLINRDRIEISTYIESKGSTKEEIFSYKDENEIFSYNNEDIEIGFNPRYLMEVFNKVSSEEKINITFGKDAFSPVVISSNNSQDLLFIIMPISL